MTVAAPPRVSIVTCTYNAAGFIGDTLRALLAQTWRDFELIVVDDASTDGTVDAVSAFDDPRIRLIRNARNLGVAAARNVGLDAARGEYLIANDHDDISLPRASRGRWRFSTAIRTCCWSPRAPRRSTANGAAPIRRRPPRTP